MGLVASLSCLAMWAADDGDEPALRAEDRAHWSFQPVKRPELPTVKNAAWVRNPIDAFVLARLEKAGIEPSPPADRIAWLRRVSIDLIGLPPTPEETQAFLNDKANDAHETVVERLLGSPHYGERWAQHWLDVVRFAESNGYELDSPRPNAFRYRDWVIDAINEDKPYYRFIIEQLAGDELAAEYEGETRTDLLVAAGLLRCAPIHQVAGNTDLDVHRQEVLTELVTTVGNAFLGVTIHCARCHDHKFDPVSMADYYRMQAFFTGIELKDTLLLNEQEKAEHDREVARLNARVAPIKKKLHDLEDPYRNLLIQLKKLSLEEHLVEAFNSDPKKRTPEQAKLAEQAAFLIKVSWDELVENLTPEDRAKRKELRKEMFALEAQIPITPWAWSVDNAENPADTYILKRGDPKRKGKLVVAGFPRVLDDEPNADRKLETRLDLAKWIARSDHPLTARVLVNRLWVHHFGRGLVSTANDFGKKGQPPTHPELLDWLASELTSNAWSQKHLHRLIVLSNTYRQTSRPAPSAIVDKAMKIDSANRLWWRMERRRLDAEALRDSVLAVAGTLNRKRHGPSVRVPLEPEIYATLYTENEPDDLWRVTPDVREHTRRSIYLFSKRNLRMPFFEAFDRPDAQTSCAVRPVSTTAPQALVMLNGSLLQTQSRAMAARLIREAGSDRGRQIERAFRLALSRPPRKDEAQMSLDFLASQAELAEARLRARMRISLVEGIPDDFDPVAASALADFCLALLNRNEFVYMP